MTTEVEPAASLELLRRGHALYGGNVGSGELGGSVGDLRGLADRLTSAPALTGVSSVRLPQAAQRLRLLADDDEVLRRLLGDLAASDGGVGRRPVWSWMRRARTRWPLGIRRWGAVSFFGGWPGGCGISMVIFRGLGGMFGR